MEAWDRSQQLLRVTADRFGVTSCSVGTSTRLRGLPASTFIDTGTVRRAN